jgi:hypothetical protein
LEIAETNFQVDKKATFDYWERIEKSSNYDF